MQNYCDIKQVVDLLNMRPSKKSQYELRFEIVARYHILCLVRS